MQNWTLNEVANVLQVTPWAHDIEFTSVSTDSRDIKQGALFIALSGENFDGHDYVEQALQRGAVAAVVSNKIDCSLPQLLVRDSRIALGQMAAAWRAGFDIPVVAITGSNGKTTVKEMIAAILSQRGGGLVTRGNFNNDIGLPLTLLQLTKEHEFAVLEMGANHPGEIEYLTVIAKPDIAVITNVSAAHLQGFGDLDGIARSKAELYAGLASDGTAVINSDDNYAEYWKSVVGKRASIRFGMNEDSNVSTTAKDIRTGMGSMDNGQGKCFTTKFVLRTAHDEVAIELSLAGRHNVMNALAAAATALALEVPVDTIKDGLELMRPVAGRLQLKTGMAGRHIIDDTYNANPGSLSVALEVLSACHGQRVLVLGDMAELGEDSEALHQQVGSEAKAAGIDALYTLGSFSAAASRAFGEAAQHFSDQGALIQSLQETLPDAATVLIKGSRRMHMENVVLALSEPLADAVAGGDSGC